MKTITLEEYLHKPESSRGVWNTERWDESNWAEVREQYMGKRTMLDYEPEHGTVLLIEGLSFQISQQAYTATHYTVTETVIFPSGKVETYLAESREDAVQKALYTHRLHNGRAKVQGENLIIHCPTCGQIAITLEKP